MLISRHRHYGHSRTGNRLPDVSGYAGVALKALPLSGADSIRQEVGSPTKGGKNPFFWLRCVRLTRQLFPMPRGKRGLLFRLCSRGPREQELPKS